MLLSTAFYMTQMNKLWKWGGCPEASRFRKKKKTKKLKNKTQGHRVVKKCLIFFILYMSEHSVAWPCISRFLITCSMAPPSIWFAQTLQMDWQCCIRSYHVIQILKKWTFGYTYNEGKKEGQAILSNMQVHSQAICTGQSVQYAYEQCL